MKDNKRRKSSLSEAASVDLRRRANLPCLNRLFRKGDIKIGSGKEDFIAKEQENGLLKVRHIDNIDKKKKIAMTVIVNNCIPSENGTYIINKRFDPFTRKVLDYSLEILLDNNDGWVRGKPVNEINGVVYLSVKDFTELLGYKNTPSNRFKIREKMIESLDTLQTTTISYKGSSVKRSFDDISIIARKTSGTSGIRVSKIKVTFISDSFLKILSESPSSCVDTVPYGSYKLKGKAYLLGDELCRQWRLNDGKKRQGIHSIKWILEFLNIPTKHRKFGEKIKDPLERNINALSFMFDWEYIDGKGNKIDRNLIKHQDDFLKLSVKLTSKYLPPKTAKKKKSKLTPNL
jgi:hypothetical protein